MYLHSAEGDTHKYVKSPERQQTSKMTKTKQKHKALFNLLLYDGRPDGLRVLEPVGGGAEVTQDVMTTVVQEDVLHLRHGDKDRQQ